MMRCVKVCLCRPVIHNCDVISFDSSVPLLCDDLEHVVYTRFCHQGRHCTAAPLLCLGSDTVISDMLIICVTLRAYNLIPSKQRWWSVTRKIPAV